MTFLFFSLLFYHTILLADDDASTTPRDAPFALLKKQTETLFRLICCERKTLFRLKKQAEKYGL